MKPIFTRKTYFFLCVCSIAMIISALTLYYIFHHNFSGKTEILYIDNIDYYSSVFDPFYYYNRYPDVASRCGSDTDELFFDFVTNGIREKRVGSKDFDVSYYIADNYDLRKIYGDNTRAYYEHYIKYGKSEGRKASFSDARNKNETLLVGKYEAVFDAHYYYDNNPDIAQVIGIDMYDLFSHFLEFGMSEGRRGNSDFDVFSYIEANPQLKDIYGDDLKAYYLHYTDSN